MLWCFFFLLLSPPPTTSSFFSFNDPATTEIYALSLRGALPSWIRRSPATWRRRGRGSSGWGRSASGRSEEHTSELQSQSNLVCRLLLEKKKKKNKRMRGCNVID